MPYAEILGDNTTTKDNAEFKELSEKLVERCKLASVECVAGVDDEGEEYVQITLASGREKRYLTYYAFAASEVRRLLGTNFENYVFLGNLDAICSYKDNVIEANIRRINSGYAVNPSGRALLSNLIGRKIESDEMYLNEKFVLKISDEDSNSNIEISPASSNLSSLLGAPNLGLSLKINGASIIQHEKAKTYVQQISNSAFFQIYQATGIAIQIPRRRTFSRTIRKVEKTSLKKLKFLQSDYPREPMALYWYAVSARELPLLQFLAFYQSVEFFFPNYSLEEAKRIVAGVVKDSTFNPYDDNQLIKLISAIKNGTGRGYGDERSQLRATIQACVSVDELREFLTVDDEAKEFFSAKSKRLGFHQISFADKNADLRDVIASRIYDIRCKIVHTKAEDGYSEVPMLLPYSEEAETLSYDIELTRFIAEKVLTANSSAMFVR